MLLKNMKASKEIVTYLKRNYLWGLETECIEGWGRAYCFLLYV